MLKKTQIFIVHGGMTFKSRRDYLDYLKKYRNITLEKKIRWREGYLDKALGAKFEIVRPRMPLKDNARYEDWKITFERYIPLLKNNPIFIGESLGGIFLAKYLSENKFPKKIKSVFLVCPPFDNSLPGEDLVGGFSLKSDLSKLEECCDNLYLMFSRDDEVVPFSQAEKYQEKLNKAKIIIYKSKNGHFNVKSFPEIVKFIKRDVKT